MKYFEASCRIGFYIKAKDEEQAETIGWNMLNKAIEQAPIIHFTTKIEVEESEDAEGYFNDESISSN